MQQNTTMVTMSGIPPPNGIVASASDEANQERGLKIDREVESKLEFRQVDSISDWYHIEGEVIPNANGINWRKPVLFAKMKRVPPSCLVASAKMGIKTTTSSSIAPANFNTFREKSVRGYGAETPRGNAMIKTGLREVHVRSMDNGKLLSSVATAPGSLVEMGKSGMGSARSSMKDVLSKVFKKKPAEKKEEEELSDASTRAGTRNGTNSHMTPLSGALSGSVSSSPYSPNGLHSAMRSPPSGQNSASPPSGSSAEITRPQSSAEARSQDGAAVANNIKTGSTYTSSVSQSEGSSISSEDTQESVNMTFPDFTKDWKLPPLKGQVVIKVRHKGKGFKDQIELKQWLKTMKTMYYISGGLSMNLKQMSNMLDLLQDDSYYYAVMEYVRGRDLFDYFMDEKPHKKPYVATIAQQMAVSVLTSVSELHYYGLIHRDLKLENFVLDEPKTKQKGDVFTSMIRMIDFDTVEIGTPGKKMRHVLGTDQYIAPECYLGYPGPSADIFSAGVVLYTLLSGTFPFHSSFFNDKQGENVVGNSKMAAIRARIMQAEINFSDNVWSAVPETRMFVEDCTQMDPGSRPTSVELLLEHPWFSKIHINKNPGAIEE